MTAQLLVKAFGKLAPFETPVVGGITRALRSLSREDQELVAEIGDRVAEQRELGRHGSVEKVYDEYQVPQEMRRTCDQIMDAATTDDIAVALQRRMGTDLDRPIEPPTSRDFVQAAFELHQGE